MGYLLLEPGANPHGEHFYRSRNKPLTAVVVHITAGLEDFTGADNSAEKTAQWCATTATKVSWHAGADGDSFVRLLPPGFTAWHCRGFNSGSWGLELSKLSADWRSAPTDWVKRILTNGAAATRPVCRQFDIPARKITAAQARDGVRGFVSHAEMDPDRRRDPGWLDDPRAARAVDTFPWELFLRLVEGDDVVTEAEMDTIAEKVVARLMAEPVSIFHGPDKGESFPFKQLVRRLSQQSARMLEALVGAEAVAAEAADDAAGCAAEEPPD